MQKWNDNLYLITPKEFDQIPDGEELTCISGEKVIKGKDYIDDDTRFGYLAYGFIDIASHPLSPLFTKFLLS